MDSHNRFETKTTATLQQAEWFAGLTVCSVLAIMHIGQINWPVFIGFFVIIDLVGYIPGAIAYRRKPDHDISKRYYVAYNIMHSLLTGGAMAGIWALAVKPEWALMAIPIHLFGDRGIFGNTLKPFGIQFEPVTHPDFVEFQAKFAAAPDGPAGWTPPAVAAPAEKGMADVKA